MRLGLAVLGFLATSVAFGDVRAVRAIAKELPTSSRLDLLLDQFERGDLATRREAAKWIGYFAAFTSYSNPDPSRWQAAALAAVDSGDKEMIRSMLISLSVVKPDEELDAPRVVIYECGNVPEIEFRATQEGFLTRLRQRIGGYAPMRDLLRSAPTKDFYLLSFIYLDQPTILREEARRRLKTSKAVESNFLRHVLLGAGPEKQDAELVRPLFDLEDFHTAERLFSMYRGQLDDLFGAGKDRPIDLRFVFDTNSGQEEFFSSSPVVAVSAYRNYGPSPREELKQFRVLARCNTYFPLPVMEYVPLSLIRANVDVMSSGFAKHLLAKRAIDPDYEELARLLAPIIARKNKPVISVVMR